MQTRHFQDFPKAYQAYPKIIKGLIAKKKTTATALPEVSYQVDQFKVDAKHLKKYNQVCGFKNNGYIPAIYLAVLSQSLQMQMMSQEAFPFAMLGLVHIRNQIQQKRKIGVNETLSLSCRFGETQPHDKGILFDFITTVSVNGEEVMQGITTYLARQKTTLKAAPAEKIKEETPNYQSQAQWPIEENIGRRYALVSGDFNLIHLHGLTAKAFGFKKAIAHGMWSKARALASISLPDAYQADVWFKLPIYLPSQVELLTADTADQTAFLIRHQSNHRPHVTGQIKALS